MLHSVVAKLMRNPQNLKHIFFCKKALYTREAVIFHPAIKDKIKCEPWGGFIFLSKNEQTGYFREFQGNVGDFSDKRVKILLSAKKLP